MTSTKCNCGACACRGHSLWWTSLGYWCSECKVYTDDIGQPIRQSQERK